MWGAVIGDLAGSVYEYGQTKKISYINVDKLITEDSFFSDDTILTCAIYAAIRYHMSYEHMLRSYGEYYLCYKPKTSIKEYFPTAFGKRFDKWLKGQDKGDSVGNGALMRISGIGKVFETEKDVIEQAMLATKPTHNSVEAIECARIVALFIFYARHGFNKNEIRDLLGLEHVEYRPFEKFNKKCYETLNNCLYAVLECKNFEETIRTVISYGGDTDTNAAIAGSMAEALYGIPEYLITQARAKIPPQFQFLLDEAYYKSAYIKRYENE